ncbi:acyl-CoA carboxylase subunit beta [Dermatophilus congolensis]|uniref:Methylmalonyl-CoA carboxyltransferase 12S subunit n=1 Tax=Dermatophilus congolensis TaxID=1863 RepID=A0A239VHU4_9MICO|nr:acyl-CoA carboxylase subunit beta [Dermatophilus congolensis]MBO3129081.1 acyl-CoA carboxylase subunit beta [Dermatophilus congolensis]MBO3132282.1 acyl-CoA carboxylase subunit beta [Dermatophilus congolensis]MBO3133557.1 acyl-CoA carboxylase subunit beta [Dermatophilus congolensis]MBO3135790.1 acyl-CoA carboxylase subunit beta [Dermatophilus congolensis]MBO3138032.1 acyl-CoA carboxylase subunit beta [Dermatophilus congolensis]
MADKPATMAERNKELRARRAELEAGGGEARIEKQHEQGKLTARERITELADEGSFAELGLFAQHRTTLFGMDKAKAPADGVVTGSATVLGRPVHIASQDFTVMGGSAGEKQSEKVTVVQKASLENGTPFIFINDSGGARVQEGIDSLSGYGKVFFQNVALSGVVPQISIIAGPCAGGAAYSPALTDFIIQTKESRMFITGPGVIKQVTGEEVSAEDLGGPGAHMTRSGVTHFVADDDAQAMLIAKKLLSFLPSNNSEMPPIVDGNDDVEDIPELNDIIPEDTKRGYDIREVISLIVDDADFLEVQAGWAMNVVIGFGRVTGRSVGIIANQPNFLAGSLDINASDKVARFVRFCNAFNIPVVNLVDVPGFLPGVEQEYGGIIRHGAKMLFAYSSATVPKITVVLRKAYGGSYLAMCSKDLGADRVFAWPTAEIAVMGAEGAAGVVFRKEIANAEDPEAKRAELVQHYREAFSTPYVAGARSQVDDIIEPASTRRMIAQSLEYLANKRDIRPPKKHGLIPM